MVTKDGTKEFGIFVDYKRGPGFFIPRICRLKLVRRPVQVVDGLLLQFVCDGVDPDIGDDLIPVSEDRGDFISFQCNVHHLFHRKLIITEFLQVFP